MIARTSFTGEDVLECTVTAAGGAATRAGARPQRGARLADRGIHQAAPF